jgi:hypothetical protein
MTLNRAYLIILLSVVWVIAWSLLGGLLAAPPERRFLANIIFPIALGGLVIGMLAGFAVWAGAKGYSPLLGVVLAWIGPLGMLILVFLRDKTRDGALAPDCRYTGNDR